MFKPNAKLRQVLSGIAVPTQNACDFLKFLWYFDMNVILKLLLKMGASILTESMKRKKHVIMSVNVREK